MNQPRTAREAFIASIFSDETAMFRVPSEPEPWDAVSVRLRLQKGSGARVTLLDDANGGARMWPYASDDFFDWYEGKLYCREAPIRYSFLVEWEDVRVHFRKSGPREAEPEPRVDPSDAFSLLPGFHVPEWAKGALQYQIFPDRFCNGNPENDVLDREYFYTGGYACRAARWDALPGAGDFRCFHGGDLEGVRQKLDYLQSLGVEVLYLNPIFVSPSSHGYDTQDYGHVDPHLTVVASDGGGALPEGDANNAHAERYIRRTTSEVNLRASDAWFADFCQELHARGMRIILDGVFNHCGSFGRWMDREGLYGGVGAFGNPDSAFRDYFRFDDEGKYECWWGVDTLPKLCYEQSEALREDILRVAEKWASPPYYIDGWRLDVAADLGQSREENHRFWKAFRRRVKAVNPELAIIAEHYGDPSEWLGGDEWDTVMNYDAFMEPVSYFLTGMEKHSDQRRDDLYQNGEAFFAAMGAAMARLPLSSLQCAMNELSNHDHSRFLTRTNGVVGRVERQGSAAASQGIRPEVFREAAVIQMTWPGAPTLYYGDEAGLTGWTDPDNRRAYPWGREDAVMLAFHRALARLRASLPMLRTGSVKPLFAGRGRIAYARFDAASWIAVACNNTDRDASLALPLRDIGVPDGTGVTRRFATDVADFDPAAAPVGLVRSGFLRLKLPARAAVVLSPEA